MPSLEPRFHWTLPRAWPVTPETIDAAARARGLSARAVRVLSRRGPIDPAGIAARFDEPSTALLDPRLLPDADRAFARVRQAVRAQERVLVPPWGTSTPTD